MRAGDAEPKRTNRPFFRRFRSINPRRTGKSSAVPLRLVKDHVITKLIEPGFRIGRERCCVGRPLEIQIDPAGKLFANQRRLATLAWTKQRHHGKTADQTL